MRARTGTNTKRRSCNVGRGPQHPTQYIREDGDSGQQAALHGNSTRPNTTSNATPHRQQQQQQQQQPQPQQQQQQQRFTLRSQILSPSGLVLS
jgi:hypothetical protein